MLQVYLSVLKLPPFCRCGLPAIEFSRGAKEHMFECFARNHGKNLRRKANNPLAKLYAKVWLLFQSSGAAKVCLFGQCRALHLNYCRLACSIISILFDAICLHFLLKFMDWNNSKHSQAICSLSTKKCQGNLQTSVPGKKVWDEYVIIYPVEKYMYVHRL